MKLLHLFFALCAASAFAAETAPGLILTFTSAGKTDARAARLAALYVPTGQAPTPFLAPGVFTARFEGAIQSPLRAECTFAAVVSGSVKMALNGVEVLAGTTADA